jgi:hypothetical protein
MRSLEEVSIDQLGEKQMRLTLGVFVDGLGFHQTPKKDTPPT